MLVHVTNMQKACSTEALNMQEVVTLVEILQKNGPASVMIHLLDLEDKRSLRLVCHAGKDAVDKTVTYVCSVGVDPKFDPSSFPECGIDYACILANSNWKDVKRVGYSAWQPTYGYVESLGLTQIAEAGLTKLERLTVHSLSQGEKDTNTADKVVKAGWKLKELDIAYYDMPSEWFGTLMRDANWPLEELTIYGCTDSIANLINSSQWKLKKLHLFHSHRNLSPEGVETLMQGSWVSTVEKLSLSFKVDREKKGVRAISQASQRAIRLLDLSLGIEFDNKDALILGEGSYPNLKALNTTYCANVSGLAAILRQSPKLEEFKFYVNDGTPHVDDPKDAQLVAEYYKNGILQVLLGYMDTKFKAQLADYL